MQLGWKRLATGVMLMAALGGWTVGPAAAKKGADKKSKAAMEEEAGGFPTVAEKTADMARKDGFLTLYLDERAGSTWLLVPPPQGRRRVALEMIYSEALTTGLGSNPVGLDRGQLGEPHLIEVRRFGPKVLFEQINTRYRALTENAEERRATAESFATSVLWAGEIAALDPDGTALVDLTSFLLADAHSVAETLRATEQGNFQVDPMRSAVDLESCLVFPDNVELDVLLTFAGDEPGRHVEATAPTPRAVTLIQHHSFVRLPDDGYQPRAFDPRIGAHAVEVADYAAPLTDTIHRRYVSRHRLEKVDPSAASSPVVEPLVYYVDRGVPEPVRSALVEGAAWWAEAFTAAGLEDAYRVELLPEGVHPLDVRYNVIQWVHRSTRGWSYGGGVIDPRTGEILKGHVNLGSLRVRQDRLLFEGLAGVEKTGSGAPDDPVELALARIRQLSAHEVGHTLGMAHNFAASTYGRASVMDYPAPLVTIGDDGELDFSQAYGVGVGAWDLHSIRYTYSVFAPGVDEAAALEAIVQEGIERGLIFLSDADARPAGASDPRANLWDNGVDPVAGLEQALAVRAKALADFGVHNLPAGRPLAELEEVLVPVYFHHRYQLDAALKVIAGMELNYAVKGDGQTATRIVGGERQRHALAVVLGILDPATLDLRDEVLSLLAPRPFEFSRHRELFASATYPAFDALGAAATAADAVAAGLLVPARLARLAEFHRRDPGLPGVAEVVDALIDRAFAVSGDGPRHQAIGRAVEHAVAERLIAAAADEDLPAPVAAQLEARLAELREALAESDGPRRRLAARLGRFLDRGAAPAAPREPAASAPPGSPIGARGQ